MAVPHPRLELESLLAGYDRTRSSLIPVLQAVQARFGYLSEQAVAEIARYLGASENDVYGVATFYAQFRFTAPAKHGVKVCQGTACHVRGAGLILDQLSRDLGIAPGQTTPDREFSLDRVACFGSCALAPVIVIDDTVYDRMSPRKAEELIRHKDELRVGGAAAPTGLEDLGADEDLLVSASGQRRLASIAQLEQLREKVLAAQHPDRTRIIVCGGTGCRAAGSMETARALAGELEGRELTGKVELTISGCHGFCQKAPVVAVEPHGIFYQGVGRKKPERDAAEMVQDTVLEGQPVERLLYRDPNTKQRIVHYRDIPFYSRQNRIVLRNNGKIDPTRIEDYLAVEGYAALAKVLELDPDVVVDTIESSGLRGRGGAGFPAGTKWRFCRNAAERTMRYVICNADEGDPGAYMDRSIVEGDPHSVLEGMIIGAYAIAGGISPVDGYVYIRSEYPLAVRTLRNAIQQAEELGLLGDNILGSGFSFHVKIKQGAGAFVCGEETALMASIEGRRGMPMPRPPFPAEQGLFGKPTNINNVETWASVPRIVNGGAEWFAGIGTEKSKGTKVFSLVGKINNSGLIEVPMGTPLRTIVEEIGGGCPGGREFKAVQTGGPSGGCIPNQHLDTPVDYEHLQELGSIMGSGGMVVMDERSCMVDVARYFLEFTESESCGKCVPCRIGTQHLLRTLTGICDGQGRAEDVDQMLGIADTVFKGSLCGLGQTAPNPVVTTLRYFAEEYRAHIEDHKCTAGVCRELVTFCIDAENCQGCAACVRACPVDAIAGEKKQAHQIDVASCIRCGSCRDACKFDAVMVQ
jgi:NADH:ubiquinone oxidoreductase subunit F (NADH-binding)/NADH:ubiquinone oxidoreductase subunit E